MVCIGISHAATTSNAVTTDTNAVNSSAQNAGNAQSITFTSPPSVDTTVRTTPSIVAPSLTTTLTDTCMGSSSGSFSGIGFGIGMGTTWTDTECVNRLNARELQSLGDKDAAKELMCHNKSVREAYKSVGRPCKYNPDN